MMKKFRKIIIWAMLSVMMQCAGLLFLDKVLFKHSSEFTAKKVEDTSISKDINISIPSDAEKVSVSFDGRYITYYQNDKLKLINTKTSEDKEILSDTEILFSKWIPKNNMIMIAEKATGDSGKEVIKLQTYNPRTDVENPMLELCNYQKGMEVQDIVTSYLSGVNYACISNGKNNTSIYRIDINNDKTQIAKKISSLGTITTFIHKDVLLYEDSLNKCFYRYTNGNRTQIHFNQSNNLIILGTDNDDNIYMGELSEDKVSKVIYGKDETDTNTWKTISLEKSKNPSDIYITSDGSILVNDNLQGKVTNILKNTTVSYNGKFISVNDKVVCSSDSGSIYLKSIEETDKE